MIIPVSVRVARVVTIVQVTRRIPEMNIERPIFTESAGHIETLDCVTNGKGSSRRHSLGAPNGHVAQAAQDPRRDMDG